jgi:glutathione S-transferase
MALAYAGIRVELREVKLGNKPPDFIHLSPKATVPVLLTADAVLLDESLDIMYWALSVSDPEQWQSHDAETVDLIRHNDEVFKPLLDAYKYADRHPQLSRLEHRKRAESFLGLLEAKLEKHSWLTAERQTISDVAIMPFVRQFAGVEPKWFEGSEYARVRSWLGRQLDSELFQRVMQKYGFWRSGDVAVYLEAAGFKPGD